MGCGNRCYSSSNPSACESMCISRCSANGGNQGGVSRAPARVWQPRYAAYASTTDDAVWSIAVEYANPQDAAARAKAECESRARRPCPVVRGTDGINVALVAESENGQTVGMIIKAGDTMAEAINPMLDWCHQHHPKADCEVVYKHLGR